MPVRVRPRAVSQLQSARWEYTCSGRIDRRRIATPAKLGTECSTLVTSATAKVIIDFLAIDMVLSLKCV